MINKKVTYADKLLADKEFRKDFEREYENLVVSEKIAMRGGPSHRLCRQTERQRG